MVHKSKTGAKAAAKAPAVVAKAKTKAKAAAKASAPRRQLDHRDTEQAMSRALERHCAHVSDQRISAAVDPQNRETAKVALRDAIRAIRSTGGRLGCAWYDRLLRLELEPILAGIGLWGEIYICIAVARNI